MTTSCTNNLVEYEAVRKGMVLLLEAGAEAVEIFGDLKLVIWICRTLNNEANDLAQMASGYKETADGVDMEVQFLEPGDWRADIFNYFEGFGSGGTQKDKTQGHEVRSDRG